MMSEKVKVIDVNKIEDLSELYEVCEILSDALSQEKEKVDDQATLVQSIYDIIDQNDSVAIDLSDFIGYQFGIMHSADMMVETALTNIQQMRETDMGKNMHIREACMFIGIWYNLGLTHIEIATDCLAELNKAENDLRIKIAEGEIEFDEDQAEERILN